MLLASPIVVRVEKQPGGLSFGESMNAIRSWLDHRQIEPASFKSVANAPSGAGFEELAQAYKRINAPVGELGLATLKISTAALAGDDATYNNLENRLQIITAFRDALAA